MPTDEEELV